jgi:hypothetical protein
LNVTSASAEPETTAADEVVVADAAPAAQVEAQPEITVQIVSAGPTAVTLIAATPPDVQAEQASADAISQVQTALISTEEAVEVVSTGVAEPAASTPIDLNPAAAVVTEPHSDSSPPPETFEAEKAA